jgi:uncharacterized GH25 family protein
MMKKLYAASLLIVGLLSASALAHKTWLRPSQTNFSGADPWVTVDAAVSNDLFYFNHFPLRLDGLQVVAPDGKAIEAANQSVGRYRSVFDIPLQQDGTYRIAVVNHGLLASWQEKGDLKRWRGNAEDFAKEVPQDESGLKVTESRGRIETFVTKNAPSTTAMEATGKGIELLPITHPNDLVSGEVATFRLLVEGEPAAGLDIEVIRGETRYRNSQDEMKVTTNAEGEFTVAWPAPGMYWLSTSTQDSKTSVPQATTRRLSYTVTLEVLPE